MIPSWARVGAKVVSTYTFTGGDDKRGFGAVLPIEGGIYTIREVRPHDAPVPGILLEEIVNKPILTTRGVMERGFALYRFRPLVTIEVDIATHFEALLHVPSNQPVDA